MTRVVVIGATGHVGNYLVPRLARGGHEVIAPSRATRGPYHASPLWNSATGLLWIKRRRTGQSSAPRSGRRGVGN
jgi:uncharacterized protein YbjT (DUF2867 family)